MHDVNQMRTTSRYYLINLSENCYVSDLFPHRPPHHSDTARMLGTLRVLFTYLGRQYALARTARILQ